MCPDTGVQTNFYMQIPSLSQSRNLRYFTFFYLYFMQGVPAGFALTAIANYLTGSGISSSAIGTFVGIVGLPWILQFVWGPLIDRYQYSVVGHRKHWVVLTQFAAFGASLFLLLVHDPANQLSLVSALFFTHSVFASVQDASVDAIAISLCPEDERGRVNAFMRGGFLLGISFGAAVLSFVLHRYGFRFAAGVQSAFLLLLTIVFFVTRLEPGDKLLPRFSRKGKEEKELPENPHLGRLFRRLWEAATQPESLRLFLLIAVVYFCFSVFIRSFSFHLVRVVGWPDQDLSVLQGSWGSLLTFVVVIAGGTIADKIGPQKLQRIVLIVLGTYLLLFNALSPFWNHRSFTTGGLLFWSLADPLYSVAAFPILMILCKNEIAGSQFTAYMALINFCDVLGSYFSGWMLHWVAAPWLGIGCGVVLLLMLLMMQRQQLPVIATEKARA